MAEADDLEPAEFDPKHDQPRSATRQQIVETYRMLVAEGFEAEALHYPARY